jgi:hypothetical protein
MEALFGSIYRKAFAESLRRLATAQTSSRAVLVPAE